MYSVTVIPFALLAASSVLAAPLQARYDSLADTAGGGPPNAPLPATISDAAITAFQGVNFLENLEAAFFGEGLQNLTKWNDHGKLDSTVDVVTKVHAQELTHIQTAETVLRHFNKPTFEPCKYKFPVNSAEEFLELSNIITSAGIGAVINVVSGLALTDPGLVQVPASVLAVEARHDAFFRQQGLQLAPNPAPFDTRISAAYALNLADPFIVPGSCKATPNFPHLTPLKADVFNKKTSTGGPIEFTFDAAKIDHSHGSAPLFIGWVNQANVVNYTTAQHVNDGRVESWIPDGLAGIAFAALTAQNKAADVNALTGETLAGPAPVQIS